MATPNRTEQFDNLYTTTWNNRRSEVIDQIFEETPLLSALKRKNGIKYNGSGGRYLEVPLAYAENDTVTSFGRGSSFSLAETQFLTVAQYEWKYVGGSIVNYWVDTMKNKGPQAFESLVNSKIDNLRRSIANNLEGQFFSDGTGNGSKDMEGLSNLVDSTPGTARTVGNIAQTTYTWWKNKQKTSTGAASIYLRQDMQNLFNTCSKGLNAGSPNLIVTDQTAYELYEDETVEQKQIFTKGMGKMGDTQFANITFKGQEMIWSPQATSGTMYMLNTDCLGLTIDPDANFIMTDWKPIPDALDRVAQVVVKGNLTCTRRASQGVLTSVSAT